MDGSLIPPTDLSTGIQDAMSKMGTHSQRTDYRKLKNRCPKCGHRMVMQSELGICTVEGKDGKCGCTSHFWTAKLMKD